MVGVTDLDTILDGVPKEAFNTDSKEAKKGMKSINDDALEIVKMLRDGQVLGLNISLFDNDGMMVRITEEQVGLAEHVRTISSMPENTLLQAVTKQSKWEELMQSPRVECLRRACDIYTYAFYRHITMDDLRFGDDGNFIGSDSLPYTRTVYKALEEIKHLDEQDTDFKPLPDTFKAEVDGKAAEHRFFHWCIEFPEVFAGHSGGFDVMCGNPPWDKIKVEDKKWFEQQGRSDIVNAGTAAQRKRAIANLPTTDPALFAAYQLDQQNAEAMSRFVRFCGRFPLTATGDIDLYPLFAEHCLNCSKEAWGLVVPTGIATSDSNKAFFAKLLEENRLVSLFDFENKEGLFDIHREYKFSILTAGKLQSESRKVTCGFWLTRMDHLLDPKRIYTLDSKDIVALNPNTKTCPVFRTSRDANLTSKIYRTSKILINEINGENPWKVKPSSMIHMSGDSYLFRTYQQLVTEGAIYQDGNFTLGAETYVPLYEGKMFYLYNHHYGEWPTEGERPFAIPSPSIEHLKDPNSLLTPWYWVPMSEVENRLVKTNAKGDVVWEWTHKWLIAFRDITTATTERTFMASLIPDAKGVGNTATLLYAERGCMPGALLLAMLSSLVFDYVAKQKCGRLHMSVFIAKQLPILALDQIPDALQWQIVKRVAELCYFNHDLDGWATELYEELSEEQQAELSCLRDLQPYVYDPDRRAVLQAELDAIFAHLYGLTTDELRYILDPEDICGPGCINETFRVLKDNELRQYGEYRTKRLVLDAWHRFNFNN